MIQPYILATAGHVDHGKSSLVKALTGTDPDRLPEEKARGITIDLGFAHLLLPNPLHDPAQSSPPNPSHFSCGIVDVPGHEDFVKNMVAGVGAVDLALLVVAADDGWMPQTEEHLQILGFLGVTRAVVALTKSDLATGLEDSSRRIREKLQGTPFATAAIVPTSIPTLTGIDTLRAALAETLAATPPPPDFGKPRLAVDRVFVLKGVGTVVTGTLTGGTLAPGDPVVVQPSGRMSRIRSCQSHGRHADRALPGTRTALNLADVDASEVVRGDVITLPALGRPTQLLDTLTLRSARPTWSTELSRRAITRGMPIRFHLGSAQITGRIHTLEGDTLEPGSRGLAQIRLDTPVLSFVGDRFLLRDSTGRATLAGGIVLDPEARRPQARHPERLVALNACAQDLQHPAPFIASALQRQGCLPLTEMLRQSRFADTQIQESIEHGIAQRRVVRSPTHLVSAKVWDAILSRMADAVDQHHTAHPESAGLPISELRSLLPAQAHFGDLWEPLLQALTGRGLQVDGRTIRRTGHRPSLPQALQALGRAIRARLQATPLDPPPRHELTTDAAAQQALGYLIRQQEVVEVGPDVVLDRLAFEFARRKILLHLKRHERATASELRQLLGTTRRVLIPLLERLDRDGVLQRDGDHHRRRPAATSDRE